MSMQNRMLMMTCVIASAALSGCAIGVHATIDPAPPPPTPDQLVGTWLAVSPWVGHRLDLFDDGTGALAAAYVSERGVIRRYTTQHWNLAGHELTATFVPVDSNPYPVYLRATANSQALWNVSISLSDSMSVPVGDKFTREERVKQLLNLLTPSS